MTTLTLYDQLQWSFHHWLQGRTDALGVSLVNPEGESGATGDEWITWHPVETAEKLTSRSVERVHAVFRLRICCVDYRLRGDRENNSNIRRRPAQIWGAIKEHLYGNDLIVYDDPSATGELMRVDPTVTRVLHGSRRTYGAQLKPITFIEVDIELPITVN